MQAIDDPVVLEALCGDVRSALGVYRESSARASEGDVKELLLKHASRSETMVQAMQQRLDALAHDRTRLPEAVGPHSLGDEELEAHLAQIGALVPSEEQAAANHIRAAEQNLLKLFREALTKHLTLETYAMLTDFLGMLEQLPTSENMTPAT